MRKFLPFSKLYSYRDLISGKEMGSGDAPESTEAGDCRIIKERAEDLGTPGHCGGAGSNQEKCRQTNHRVAATGAHQEALRRVLLSRGVPPGIL